ncbi:MAG: carboxylate-amine ligase [Maritimibacter sp.]
MTEPEFTLGIEEEYLLVDQSTLALAQTPPGLMEACRLELDGQVSPEFLQCQIEVGTGVCADISEARADLSRLRKTVAKHANIYGLAPIAAACHPFSDWKDQSRTDKERYNDLSRDLGGVARRLLICGMHVHVGLPDPETRIDISNQLTYFLPHLLALSASSPFWQGEDTGLASYRLTIFDNLPRTGLPPQFGSWGEYERSVQAIVGLGVIEDSSKIWWDLRPSARFPTLETRICDVTPRLETALTIAALIQSLTRFLWRLKAENKRWRLYDNFLIAENRWHAQRYGTNNGLIDFGRGEVIDFEYLIEELIDLLRDDAMALGCLPEVENARRILVSGTSADRQRATYATALEAKSSKEDALKSVVRQLIEDFHAEL